MKSRIDFNLFFTRDGMISKAEMKTYFFKANCHVLQNSFKHEFHETTYLKPTFCTHCTGLVSFRLHYCRFLQKSLLFKGYN